MRLFSRLASSVAMGCALLFSHVPGVGAQEQPLIPFTLHVPTGCVSDASLDSLGDRLGVRFSRVEGAPVEVHIVARAGAFEAQLRDRANQGEPRRFTGQVCEQVAQAAALIVALAAQPVSIAQEVLQVAPDAASSERRAHLHLMAEPTLDWGSLPQLTAGVGGSVGARVAAWSGELWGAAHLPRTTREGPTREASAEVRLASGGLRGCYVFGLRHAQLGPCVSGELGVLWARGLAVTSPRALRGHWSAATLGVMVLARAQRFTPGLRVDVLFPVRRPRVYVDDFGEVFQAGRVGLRAAFLMRFDVF